MVDIRAIIDSGFATATMTFVASRNGVSLGTAAATVTQIASLASLASASIDMSSYGAGVVDLVLVVNVTGAIAWESRIQIDASGTAIDPLASIENTLREDSINVVQTVTTAGATVNVTSFLGEESPKTIPTADYASTSIKVVFERFNNPADLAVVLDASLTKTTNSVTFNVPTAIAERTQFLRYAIRKTADDELLIRGNWRVKKEPV